MQIVKVQKERQICSVCFQPLKVEEEVFKFWNKTLPNKPVKHGHIKVKGGEVHFRHLICQYNTKNRNQSFEEWLRNIRENMIRHSISQDIKKAMQKVKPTTNKEVEE
jgi:hypothetical protein